MTLAGRHLSSFIGPPLAYVRSTTVETADSLAPESFRLDHLWHLGATAARDRGDRRWRAGVGKPDRSSTTVGTGISAFPSTAAASSAFRVRPAARFAPWPRVGGLENKMGGRFARASSSHAAFFFPFQLLWGLKTQGQDSMRAGHMSKASWQMHVIPAPTSEDKVDSQQAAGSERRQVLAMRTGTYEVHVT